MTTNLDQMVLTINVVGYINMNLLQEDEDEIVKK